MLRKLKKLNYHDFLRREVLLLAFALAIGFWVAWNTLFVVLKNNRLQQDIQRLQEEVALLELENQNLELGIQYYRTDDYLQVEAREGLLKQAPDERVAIAPKTKNAPYRPAVNEAKTTSEEASNPELWWEFITGAQTDS